MAPQLVANGNISVRELEQAWVLLDLGDYERAKELATATLEGLRESEASARAEAQLLLGEAAAFGKRSEPPTRPRIC